MNVKALFQVLPWRQTADMLSPEPTSDEFTDTHQCFKAFPKSFSTFNWKTSLSITSSFDLCKFSKDILSLVAGRFHVTGPLWGPVNSFHKGPVTQALMFCDFRLNELLKKHSLCGSCDVSVTTYDLQNVPRSFQGKAFGQVMVLIFKGAEERSMYFENIYCHGQLQRKISQDFVEIPDWNSIRPHGLSIWRTKLCIEMPSIGLFSRRVN